MELRQSEMDFGDQMMLKVLIEKEINFRYQFLKKPPVFTYVKTKVSIENILKFMFLSNLELSYGTGRLDLFALYGQTNNYHSVDRFCHQCIKIAKN